MTEPLTWDKISYRAGGKRTLLISGECHYFRIARKHWEKVLREFKSAGGNCVATYIPWMIHEPEEGTFLFSGREERDLEGFLNLCAEMELYCICRPGPYAYSELRFGGIPLWLSRDYPETLAQTVKGKPMKAGIFSYLHPRFLEKAERWFDAVCPIIARHQTERGGAAALVQLDNELFGIHIWNGSMDYNREAMGFGAEEGLYPAFLKGKYGTIETLNRRYATDFSRFADVEPASLSGCLPLKDYQEFYYRAGGEYIKRLAGFARRNGVTCPFVHNPGNISMAPFMEEGLGGEETLLYGADHYYNLGPGWPFTPTPLSALEFAVSSSIMEDVGVPSSVWELQGGSPNNWPPIFPDQLEGYCKASAAYGVKGINFYVFAGGVTPFDACQFNPYDYQAAISPEGERTETYGAVAAFIAFLREHPFLAEAEGEYDFSLGYDRDYIQPYVYASEAAALGFTGRDALDFLKNGLFASASSASWMPQPVLLRKGKELDRSRPLLIPASVSMSREVQETIAGFVRDGGKALLAPVIPFLDEDFAPCTILEDLIGAGRPEVISDWETISRVLDFSTLGMIPADDPVYGFRSGAEAQVVSRLGETVTGFVKDFPGGGRVLWLGFRWKHSRNEHRNLITEILRLLGAESSRVRCSNPHIWCAVRSDGKTRLLFLMNFFAGELTTTVSLIAEKGKFRDLGQCTLKPFEVKTVMV